MAFFTLSYHLAGSLTVNNTYTIHMIQKSDYYNIYCCIHATKGVEPKMSTTGMYFYRTAYRQYVQSGSDTHTHYWLTSGMSILPLLLLNACY